MNMHKKPNPRRGSHYWTIYNPNVVLLEEHYVPVKHKSRAGVEYTHYKKTLKVRRNTGVKTGL